jgi:hypothetical protein
MNEENTTQHMKKKTKLDEENNDTNEDNKKIKNDTENDKKKNTRQNSASETTKNDAKTNKSPTQTEQQTPKYNIEKPTDEALIEAQRQPPKAKMTGKILANQRIDRLKKTTHSKQTTDNNTNDEEHKMEEDDRHTTNNAKNNSANVTTTPTQKVGKLQQIKKSQPTKDDNAKNEEQTNDAFKLSSKRTAQTQPHQLTYIDDIVTVLPLTVRNQHFIRPLTELTTHCRKLQVTTSRTKLPDQISHHFQELTIDQILEQNIVQLPDMAHQLVFEFLGLTTPPREYENTKNAEDIRLRLSTSKDKQKTLRNIQRQWCQPALRKAILADIRNYSHRDLRPWDMPALYEEAISSDEEDSHHTARPRRKKAPRAPVTEAITQPKKYHQEARPPRLKHSQISHFISRSRSIESLKAFTAMRASDRIDLQPLWVM